MTWTCMDLNKEGNGYRLYMLRDLNGWARGRVRVGISGAFRVKREKYNGNGVDFSTERGSTYFEHERLHRNTRVARGKN